VRTRAWVVGAAVAAALAAAATADAATRHTPTEQAFVRTINEVRAAHGLKPVTSQPALIVAAREYSHEMVRTQMFEHERGWWKRLVRAGATGTVVGENLGFCASEVCPGGTPELLMSYWLRSPEHRKNILDPKFDHVGVGVVTGPFEGWRTAYVVTTDFDG
jgi:uncharacterized protein YkwD